MGNKKIKIKTLLVSMTLFLLASGTASAMTASVSWDQNTEDDLAGYKVYYGMNPRTEDCPEDENGQPTNHGYTDVIDAGLAITKDLGTLIDNPYYYFSVTAYDTSGNESCFSAETSKPQSGDLNMDRSINIKDIQLCIKTILGTLTDENQAARCRMMVYSLTVANIKDIQAIIRKIVSPN